MADWGSERLELESQLGLSLEPHDLVQITLPLRASMSSQENS